MSKTLSALNLTNTQTIFVLDLDIFQSRFDASFSGIIKQISQKEEATQMLQLLAHSASISQTPYAIIANYELLAENNFIAVRQMRSNLMTMHVPIIAIARDKTIKTKHLLAVGIDDMYFKPVDCADLLARIRFLNQYKPLIAEAELDKTEALTLRLPWWKRPFDIAGSVIMITLLSPILVTTAVLVRLESRGPVFYTAKRSGKGFEVIKFWKFRSMVADADKKIKELQHLNQYTEGGDSEEIIFQKFKDDPRITRIGKIIRKTSIDELPQLFNVLKGDMSLVGNRPLPLYEAEQLTKEDWAYRFLAPAGVTGAWQVTKRGGKDMSAEERILLDINYAKEKPSFWRDLGILAKTPFAMISKEDV